MTMHATKTIVSPRTGRASRCGDVVVGQSSTERCPWRWDRSDVAPEDRVCDSWRHTNRP